MKKIFSKIISLILVIICIFLAITVTAYRNNWLKFDYSDYGVHISVDDTLDLFSDLTSNENKYITIFDNPTLKFCKEMHDEYGAVFSFYVFDEWNGFKLESCTKNFKKEFEENADWLRFNYHAYNYSENLNTIDTSAFQKEYDTTMNTLISIVGENSIDNATRLTMFSGTQDILQYISKDTSVFYTADDLRDCYYFDTDTSKKIYFNELYYDENLTFIKTDLRLDYTENPYYALFYIVNRDSDKRIEIFTHEWLLKQGSIKSQSIWKIREVCRFAYYYKMKFEF